MPKDTSIEMLSREDVGGEEGNRIEYSVCSLSSNTR